MHSIKLGDDIMRQLTLRISEETLKKLQEYAYKRNLTVTDYVLSRAIPNYLDEVLTVDKVLDTIVPNEI
jgi:uncharacterized protein (DUF1778 family)